VFGHIERGAIHLALTADADEGYASRTLFPAVAMAVMRDGTRSPSTKRSTSPRWPPRRSRCCAVTSGRACGAVGPNIAAGNDTFGAKKGICGASEFVLTKGIAAAPAWGPLEINARQKGLAELAVKTWPLTV
jgi:hypothetical protein